MVTIVLPDNKTINTDEKKLILYSDVFKAFLKNNKTIKLPKNDYYIEENNMFGTLTNYQYYNIFFELLEDKYDNIIINMIPANKKNIRSSIFTQHELNKFHTNLYKVNIYIYLALIATKYNCSKIYNHCISNIYYIFNTNMILFTIPIFPEININHNLLLKLIRINKLYNFYEKYVKSNMILTKLNISKNIITKQLNKYIVNNLYEFEKNMMEILLNCFSNINH